jgi:hypothetical protein
MRALLAVAMSLALVHPSFADDGPPVALETPHHSIRWYAGWGMIVAGAAAQLTGVGLTTQANVVDGVQQPGLSGSGVAGWSLVGIGAALWIGGAVFLKLTTGSRAPGSRR